MPNRPKAVGHIRCNASWCIRLQQPLQAACSQQREAAAASIELLYSFRLSSCKKHKRTLMFRSFCPKFQKIIQKILNNLKYKYDQLLSYRTLKSYISHINQFHMNIYFIFEYVSINLQTNMFQKCFGTINDHQST